MVRDRKRKKMVIVSPLKPHITSHDGRSATEQFQDRQTTFNHEEVERRIAAIRAIQVAEVHAMLGRLHVLRSYFSKEQLQTPALKFFEENLCNLLVVRNEESEILELRQIEKNCGNERVSLVNVVDDLRLSVESAKHKCLNPASVRISDFVLDGASDSQMSQILGLGEALQTPGEISNRLSFGMTPKTSRLPKQGEMLLSVHGSPLGVYKEDHLEAIHESGDDYDASS